MSLQVGERVPAPQTITLSPIPAAVPWNTGVQLAATGGGSGNPVVFSVVSGPGVIAQPGLGVPYPNLLTFTRAGTVVIAANQAGNADFTAAPQVTETIVAQKLEQVITFGRVGNPAFPVCGSSDGVCVYGGAPILLNPKGGGSPNPVTCTVRGPGIVNDDCTQVQITGAGSITVAAHQKGNDQYLPAGLAEIGFYVQKASQAITFDPLPGTVVYGSGPLTLHATGGGSGNPVTFTVRGPGTIIGDQLYITGTGSITVSAYQRGNENYTSAGRVAHGIYVQKP